MGLGNVPSSGGESGLYASDGDVAPEIMAEINITPLTDIFLVLLIIFMVTSSVMSQLGMDVDLPAASETVSASQPEGVILTLLPNGAMRVNDISVSAKDWGTMISALEKAFQNTTSKLVILEGDRKAFLGSAIEVMDYARQAGAENFAIATSVK